MYQRSFTRYSIALQVIFSALSQGTIVLRCYDNNSTISVAAYFKKSLKVTLRNNI